MLLLLLNTPCFRLPLYNPSPPAPLAPWPFQPANDAMVFWRRLEDTTDCRSCDEDRNAHCDAFESPGDVKATLSCDLHPTTSCDFERCDGNYDPSPPPLPPWEGGSGSYPAPPPVAPPEADHSLRDAAVISAIVLAVLVLLIALYYLYLYCSYTRVQDGPLHYFCCCLDLCAPNVLRYDRVAPEPINAYAAEQADPITRKVVLKEYRPPPAPIPKRRIFEDRAIYRPAVGESVASEEDAELIGQWRTVAQSVLHAKGAKMSMPAIKLPIPPD